MMNNKRVISLKKNNYCYGNGLLKYRNEIALITRDDLNSEDHRTIKPEDINSTYVLVCGCSNSAGYGVHKEQMYSQLLQEHLGIPVYNISIPGSGCDFISLNTSLWIDNYPIKPSLVVLQWIDPTTRMFYQCDDSIYVLGPWTIDENHWHDLWRKEPMARKLYRESLSTLFNRSVEFRQNLVTKLKELNIPVLEYNFIADDSVWGNYIPTIDRASDNSHIGPLSHSLFADTIYNQIMNDLQLSKIFSQ